MDFISEERKREAESEAPDWYDGGRVHNWKNHVPEHVRSIWKNFDQMQRLALYQWAENLANNEEWWD